MLGGLGNSIVNMIGSSATGRSTLMFMIVTYPWPAPSAHVELTGPHHPDAAMDHRDAAEVTTGQHARRLEEMVCWTGPERLRFQWYRFRIAIGDICR
jgi:hypothetical protein